MSKFQSLVNCFSRIEFTLGALVLILLQIYINPFTTEEYRGIRIALSDFILPVSGIIVAARLLSQKYSFPSFHTKYTNRVIIVLSLWLCVSVFTPIFFGYSLSLWSTLNKGVGWLVLIAYFYFGAWLSQQCSMLEKHRLLTLLVFGFIMTSVLWSGHYIYHIAHVFTHYQPYAGSFINRNAWAFMSLLCLVISSILCLRNNSHLNYSLFCILWGLVPLLLITYNGSRAGMACTILIFGYFLIVYRKSFFALVKLPLLFFAVLTMILYSLVPQIFFSNDQIHKITKFQSEIQATEEKLASKKGLRADQVRYIVAQDAFELWSTSPFVGAGIGSFMAFQIEKRGYLIEIIDSTPLWILTEMGLIGLILFGLFFSLIGVTLWNLTRKGNKIAEGTLLILFIFAVGSLVHQLFYFRPVWLLLGFALAKSYSDESSGEA